MRFFTIYCSIILIAFVLAGVLPAAGEQQIYERTVRLHVLAASDGEEDQRIKYEVRDAILECFGSELANFANSEEATAYLSSRLSDIEAEANRILNKNNVGYSAKAVLSKEGYPRREYENVALPAGEYTSLRVCLGEAQGQNWWCVLFPPLCVSSALGEDVTDTEDAFIEAGFTPEEYKLVTGQSDKYILRFRILELLQELSSNISKRFS